MADMITIHHLSALIQDQHRILRFLEDHRDAVPVFDPVFPDRNLAFIEIDAEPWSITTTRHAMEFTHRDAGRTVLMREDHPSAFDFHPRALLHYVLSQEEGSKITDIAVDNWILLNYRRGRLAVSPHHDGYYTFA